MKTCINAWSVPGDVGFEAMFRDIKAAGFDGIELNVDKGGAHALTLDMTDAALAEIKAISDKYELPVVSISTSLWGASMAHDPDMAKKILVGQLRCAKALAGAGEGTTKRFTSFLPHQHMHNSALSAFTLVHHFCFYYIFGSLVDT